MIISSNVLSCEEANNKDLVDYLSQLGFEPKRVSGHQYWYLSPFRDERTASFKVNRHINCWYDFGEGNGGTLIDFGIRYFHCTVSHFLTHVLSSPAGLQSIPFNSSKSQKGDSKIEVIGVKDITSLSLRNYLKERKINTTIAEAFCKEISFLMNDKKYFAIGFQNDSGGYELRNSFFKGSTHPKTITSLCNNGTTASLFEGFFDFLSYKTLFKDSECVTEDYFILNSLSFVAQIKESTQHYPASRIFFDHDKSGIKATREVMQYNTKSTDRSHLYQYHKDFNDWLVNFGLNQEKGLRNGLKQSL